MKCAFCNRLYSPFVGCCDMAAISAALTAIKYHTDCNHEEVTNSIAQLEGRLEVYYAEARNAEIKLAREQQKTRLGRE